MASSDRLPAGLTAGPAATCIAALDWDSCALGPFSAWPAPLQTAVRMMLASRFAMFIAWGEVFPYLYNDACIPIVGARHPFAMGKPFREVWPEVWEELSPLLHDAMQGRTSFHENYPVALEVDGELAPHWYTFSYSPLFDSDGQARGLLSIAMDTTAAIQAGRRQDVRRALDDRIRDLSSPADIAASAAELLGAHFSCDACFFAELEPDGAFVRLDGSWSNGRSPPLSGRQPLADLLPDGALSVPLLKEGVPHVLVCGHREAGRWTADDEALAMAIGERTWAAIGRARAEEAVREAARELRLLTDALPVLIAYVDSDRRYRFNNKAYEDWFGRPRDQVAGKHLAEVIGEKAYAELKPTIDRALAGEHLSLDKKVPFRTGGTRNVHIDYVPRLSPAGEVQGYYALVQDIGERIRADEHRQLLVNELNHRVRNTLAVVQSLAAQSFKKGMPLEAGRRAFEARLRTLGAAHNLLTSENWDSATLDQVVREAVAVAADGRHLEISGPAVRLAPQTAVSIALAMHELCTNALKYGAFSVPEGCVSVAWTVADDVAGTSRLQFVWEEVGGPEVRLPTARGFGSRLLETGLAAELRGRVKLEFLPAGLVCRIDAPLPAGT